ncbi:hypothetical protein Shyd_55400 [Streptomyces hydrogenans]|uniref:Uncharacterized protein n=1 Tax=Streptomyces hydrogenans TaxID=1873719 RepID=A0ABQ3PGM7_9ACTN|nr:hypothetical protein GCM10018784_30590 [Streptomyces hydrogenans]GHI23347.1 hypothetical protein Shyd_47180 [Streptomyces hydrogenans]GHI23356.1 hypothetical protein Shyd_47270 [Streptomyces hydrogenans]GHI24169.1 hypothetical protein Shyd_55400 [Streptomyces hydrogenans]
MERLRMRTYGKGGSGGPGSGGRPVTGGAPRHLSNAAAPWALRNRGAPGGGGRAGPGTRRGLCPGPRPPSTVKAIGGTRLACVIICTHLPRMRGVRGGVA